MSEGKGRNSDRSNAHNRARPTSAITSPGNVMNFFQAAMTLLPSIRLPLQLCGFALTIAGVVIVELVSPNNVAAMVSAGTVGVGLIIFATLFVILPQLPRPQRVVFIIIMFGIYIGSAVYLVKMTYDLISSGARQVTEVAYQTLFAKLDDRRSRLALLIEQVRNEIGEYKRRAELTTSLLEREELARKIMESRESLSRYQIELEGVTARLQEFSSVGHLISNVVVELHKLQTEPDIVVDKSRVHIEAAEADASLGDFDRAEKVVSEELQQAERQRGRANLLLGQISELKGEMLKAKAYYSAAATAAPSDPEVIENNGRILRLLGQFNDSAAMYKVALELAGGRSLRDRQWLKINYGLALWHAGEREGARSILEEAYRRRRRIPSSGR